jgi:prepilin-type N-terminal cleavage/methylation domain-containing protein
MRTGEQMKRRGFTLVETVVTVGIIAALAAVVYPTVVKQFDSADPARASNDLNSLSTAIETFGVNVRPNQPQEIEDLVNLIQAATVGDSTALGAAYTTTDVTNWNGPYLGISVPANLGRNAVVITTGFGGTVNNRLPLFDVDVANPVGGDTVSTANSANGDFVSVLILGLSGAAFKSLNEQIDGPTESTVLLRRNSGKLRCPYASGSPPADDAVACPAAYYLASPLRH